MWSERSRHGFGDGAAFKYVWDPAFSHKNKERTLSMR